MPQLYYSAVISSSLSLFGSLSIISTILLIQDLQSLMFRLLLSMAISNTITSISMLIPHFSTSLLCKIQGFLLSFGSYSSLLWTACIMRSLYKLIVFEQNVNNKFELFSHIFIWSTSIIISSIGINYYEYQQVFCWIKDLKYTYLMIIEFHGPFLIVLTYDIIICAKIWLYLKSCRESEEIVHIKRLALKKFVFYPVILLTCYIPVIIHRFFERFTNAGLVIDYLTVIGDSIVGFACFLFFISNKSVRSAVAKKILDKDKHENMSMMMRN